MGAILPVSTSPVASSPSATKAVLEDLLRARRLQVEAPPLRGEEGRLRPLGTGVVELDALLGGGFPCGRLSEIHGPVSSGRTGLLLALLARVTGGSALAALVDPLDRLDPASAAAAGVDLTRLLWLRGSRGAGDEPPAKALADATAAAATLVTAGLFDLVAVDLAGTERERRRLPGTTWLRLQRMVEETRTALVLVADVHVARGPGGVALALEPAGLCWSGPPGPGRLLAGLAARAWAGHHAAPCGVDLAFTTNA
jgi:recombination protein RecA